MGQQQGGSKEAARRQQGPEDEIWEAKRRKVALGWGCRPEQRLRGSYKEAGQRPECSTTQERGFTLTPDRRWG